MAKAVADPVEIRRFAHDLKRFNTEIQGQMQSMQARMGTLAQTWRDQEQAKFEEEFDATPLETVDEFRRRNGGGNPPKPPQEDLAKMSPEDKALKKEVETKASGETVQERVYARNDTLLTT